MIERVIFNFKNNASNSSVAETAKALLYHFMMPVFSSRSILFLIVLSETSTPEFLISAAISFEGVLAFLFKIPIIFWSNSSSADYLESSDIASIVNQYFLNFMMVPRAGFELATLRFL